MLRGYRYITVAVGLILLLGLKPSIANSFQEDMKGFSQIKQTVENITIADNSGYNKRPNSSNNKNKYSKKQGHKILTLPIHVTQNYGHRQHGAPNPRKNCDDKCKREKRDLNAQESMAKAAWAMFFATIFTIVIGVGGLVFLWKDINVSRGVGQAQTRAYINVEGARYTNTENKKPVYSAELGFKALVTIKNLGQSPARNVRFRRSEHTILATDMKNPSMFVSKQEFEGRFTIGSSSGFTATIDNLLSDDEFKLLMNGDAHIHLFGEVLYEDVFQKSWRTTYWLRVENFGTDRMRIFAYGDGNHET